MSLPSFLAHNSGELRLIAAFIAGAASTLAAGMASRVFRTRRIELAESAAEQALRRELTVVNLKLAETTTDLEKTRHESAAARAEAERASAAKSMFVANISHELRTPLNAILGFAEMIEREMFGPLGHPRYLDYVRDIEGAAEHLKSLMDDLLDISRVQANRYELHAEWLDPAEALAEPLRMVSDRAARAELRIDTDFDPICPKLFADRRALVQMALNLLTNAIKFTEGGRVSLRTRLAATGDFLVEVEDTGCGIAPEDLERVLQPFEQVDNDQTRRHHGAGLGLPLVNALIRLHEGTLAIESQLGTGTKIALRFPASRVALELPDSEASATGLRA
ncbi:MAG TPA: HAMP domain-containing sensor histidine kinase [Alphaproteobacteria bacterium]|nr:HAMP domain-containing sensor histidine kinase [Alphaproteobacteria bacterium]